ncbi:glycosyltransferase [Klebsiella quasipneumoniae]|uniref:glycosyltransferase n=1 Tax=Klebsiella quasipneumoniae TaxID=1463165 RepID=UPI001C26FFD8|nr:glycosyltransferase [Klebsiella quasipneumoniae]MBU8944554.1 glycosyltransferase [Klebsiella quasipneumoniae]
MKCTALIVTFNRLDKLKKTVAETLQLDFTTVLIVNNGSADGTQAWLESITDRRVVVLNLLVNSGGAGGFKAGSQYICETIDTDWIFFYDDDAFPASNILNKFIALDKKECHVFTGLVKDLHGHPCVMNIPFRKIPSSLADTLRYIRNPQRFTPVIDESVMVETVSFVGMIISSRVLREHIYHIHDELFIYFDDLYFGYALTLDGESICYSPDLIFYHDVSIQGKIISPEWKVYYLCRNLILARKIFSKVKVFSNFSILIRLCKYLSILPWQRRKWSYLCFMCRGIAHGIRGISGKQH